MLRQHQAEMMALCGDIAHGNQRGIREIICEVTPGGGKSLLPVIAANALIPQKADRICWVVPRRSLQRQAEESFVDGYTRRIIGHSCEIRATSNTLDPSRDTDGYTTTYQAIAANPDLHRMEFERYRYILVLDEPHHIEEDATWQHALAPLIEKAACVVYMSGTLERGNGRRIAFLPYAISDKGEVIDYEPTPNRAVIRYSRREALREKAIIPAFFQHMDGRGEYLNTEGENQKFSSLATTGRKEAPEAIYTALNTDYARQLLDKAAQAWQAHREFNNHAKFLVVAASKAAAQGYLVHLRKSGIRAEIATSDDTDAALDAIVRFKKRDGLDALVTVMMAYEGLDVPSVTHLACLTHIRSRPWIEQMIARATRFDRVCGIKWEEQNAYIFCPDDPLMKDIIERINDEQDPLIALRSEREDSGPKERAEMRRIVPLGSALTQERVSELGADGMGYEETAQMKLAMQKNGIPDSISPLQIKRLMVDIGAATAPNSPINQSSDPEIIPMSERERNLLKSIDGFCKTVDAKIYGCNWGTTNGYIMRQFGKPRREMSYSELAHVWTWLQANYKFPEIDD